MQIVGQTGHVVRIDTYLGDIGEGSILKRHCEWAVVCLVPSDGVLIVITFVRNSQLCVGAPYSHALRVDGIAFPSESPSYDRSVDSNASMAGQPWPIPRKELS